MDPVDEFHSPYLYVGNNPIRMIDPDGMGEDDTSFWSSLWNGFCDFVLNRKPQEDHKYDEEAGYYDIDAAGRQIGNNIASDLASPNANIFQAASSVLTAPGLVVADIGQAYGAEEFWKFSSSGSRLYSRWPAGTGLRGVKTWMPASQYLASQTIKGGFAGAIFAGGLEWYLGGSTIDVIQAGGVGFVSGGAGTYTGIWVGGLIGGPPGVLIGGGAGVLTSAILDYSINTKINDCRNK